MLALDGPAELLLGCAERQRRCSASVSGFSLLCLACFSVHWISQLQRRASKRSFTGFDPREQHWVRSPRAAGAVAASRASGVRWLAAEM